MNCPRCADQQLRRQDLGEREFIAVDQCPRCRGVWIDHVRLERLEAGVWSSVEELGLTSAEALSALICPGCSASMASVSPEDHPELTIERCPSCHGLWLDHDELVPLHDIVAEHVAEHGGLRQRPDGWSYLRWVTYRLAERWKLTHEE